VGPRNREKNDVHPERCGIRLNKLAAIHRLVVNALTLFRDLKSAESSPWQSLVPRELFLPVTRSLSRYCLDSDTWSASAAWAPNMGASAGVCSDFWTGFSFQTIFRERLFSCIADYRRDVCRSTCECHQTSIRLGVPQIACCTPAQTAAEPVSVWLLSDQLVSKVRRVGIKRFFKVEPPPD
jgi:hypothetical protein